MGMDDSTLDDSWAVKLTGKIMMIAILVLFLVVVFVLCLHLYAKWYCRHNLIDSPASSRRRRRRFVFAPNHPSVAGFQLRRGLDPLVLNFLPSTVFNPQDFKTQEGLECAVCLCDVVEGDKIRMLPKCEHGFHVECIDMWFDSHSTCPLCRGSVEANSVVEVAQNLGEEFSVESPNFPINVLFWGDQNRVSSGGPGSEEGTSSSSNEGLCASCSSENGNGRNPRRVDGMLVIDIPNERTMALGSPGSARFNAAEEELKSPMATRLRSLKRLLSRDSRRISPCSTSSGVDLEAGGRAQTPQS